MPIRIHNVMTNIVGRARTERIVEAGTWERDIQPVLAEVMKTLPFQHHRALIGNWTVELFSNDAHMSEFFVKNWKVAPGGALADIHCFVVNELRDKTAMMKLLGISDEAGLRVHRDRFLKAIEDPKYKASLRDPVLSGIASRPDTEQLEIALFAPATVYSSEHHAFLSLNTNYYGQLKSKSSLGPLEEFLIRKAETDPDGKIKNPKEVWLSMHAGCVEYVTEENRRRGIVIIAPTGTGKSTHCYGLVGAKRKNSLHSDDWVFTNVGTREVKISENRFYMRTNIAAIYPDLIPLLVGQPLENVGFSPEIIELLQKFDSAGDLAKAIRDRKVSTEQYQKIIEQMIENNSARSLIDPRLIVGEERFNENVTLTDLILMKRDYDDTMLIRRIDEEKMIEILTSKGNVFNYVYGKNDVDGYGIPQNRTTEIYYNPYLCVCEVDRDSGKIDPLDRIRIEAYRALVRHAGVAATWVNTRLAANQNQACLRIYLEEQFDELRVEKGADAESEIVSALGLQKKNKPAAEGRRAMDLTGFFDASGQEVEIVTFREEGRLQQACAFYKKATEKKSAIAGFLAAGKMHPVSDFYKKYASLGLQSLLGHV